jgi:hypothetical protein
MKLIGCRIVGVRSKSFGGTISFSNCHIIRLDTGSLVLIVFDYSKDQKFKNQKNGPQKHFFLGRLLYLQSSSALALKYAILEGQTGYAALYREDHKVVAFFANNFFFNNR